MSLNLARNVETGRWTITDGSDLEIVVTTNRGRVLNFSASQTVEGVFQNGDGYFAIVETSGKNGPTWSRFDFNATGNQLGTRAVALDVRTLLALETTLSADLNGDADFGFQTTGEALNRNGDAIEVYVLSAGALGIVTNAGTESESVQPLLNSRGNLWSAGAGREVVAVRADGDAWKIMVEEEYKGEKRYFEFDVSETGSVASRATLLTEFEAVALEGIYGGSINGELTAAAELAEEFQKAGDARLDRGNGDVSVWNISAGGFGIIVIDDAGEDAFFALKNADGTRFLPASDQSIVAVRQEGAEFRIILETVRPISTTYVELVVSANGTVALRGEILRGDALFNAEVNYLTDVNNDGTITVPSGRTFELRLDPEANRPLDFSGSHGTIILNGEEFGAGNTLTLIGTSAVQLTNFSGTLVATGLSADLSVETVGATMIMAQAATGGITLTGVGDVTITALSTSVDARASSGALTITTVESSTPTIITGTGTTIINSGNNNALVDAALLTDTLEINGAGVVTVTDLRKNVDAVDFTGAFSVTTTVDATLTATTGSGNTVLNSNGTGTITVAGAALASTSTLTLNGSSTFISTDLSDTTVAYTGSGSLSLAPTGDLTLDLGASTGAVTVDTTAQGTGHLMVKGTRPTGPTITGDGTVTVNVEHADTSLANVASTIDLTVVITAPGSTALTAAQADGATVTGPTGTFAITNAAAETAYDFSDVDVANTSATFSTDGRLATTVFGSVNRLIVAGDIAVTITTAQATGKALETNGSSKFVFDLADGDDLDAAVPVASMPTTYDLALQENSSVTLRVAQHQNAATVTGGGAETVTFSDTGVVTADAAIEAYVLSDAGNTLTVNAAQPGVNITGGAGSDTVIVGGTSVTGIYALGGGANIVRLGEGANIAGAEISATDGSYVIEIEAGASVTMTSVQHAFITSASGTETVILSDAAAAITANAQVEAYVLAAGGNTLTVNAGQAGVNITGGDGNDTVIVGDFTVTGKYLLGAGDDVVAVSDVTFTQIDGGTGTDTLRLEGSGLVLDLTTLSGRSLDGIEQIDLGGNGNQLILDQIQLERLSDSSNTLRVLGDTMDSVVVNYGSWTAAGTVTEGALTFDIYTNGNATLELQQGVGQTGFAIPAIELSAISLDSDARGFVINGISLGDRAGSVSSAGDVNGDGFDDLIIGAPYDDPNGIDSGASFVVFGKTDGTAVELSNVEAGNGGFAIIGAAKDDRFGGVLNSAGDVNGDGLDDLIVGAPLADPSGLSNAGTTYVVFGKTDGMPIALTAIASGTGGFAINGVSAGDRSGRSVSLAGDVNGDGFDDLIVGAPYDDPTGHYSGASFVVFGKTDGTAVALSSVEAGTGGFAINGVSVDDRTGFSVSLAGDVNGDGLDDLIVGARGDDPNGDYSGASFVVFGKTDSKAVSLSDVEAGTGGFVINGLCENDEMGFSVNSAGDVNGDGFDDLIVGAAYATPNGNWSGASYVVFGKTDGKAVELSDFADGTGTAGFVINGAKGSDYSGRDVSSAGDVNGDGLDDLIVGARGADPNGDYSGASFVVFGKADGGAVELSDVTEGVGGFVINGVSEYDYSGGAVSAAGDVNGDGFDDLIVGASSDSPNGSRSGASFVVFGGDFTGAATQVGTVGDDALTGTVDRDVLVGGTGNDTLVGGGGGGDVLYGGAGDDLLAISDLAFMRIDGGNGTDTLRLDGTGLVLDLTLTGSSMIDGIERIDLGGNGNQLILDQIQLQRLSDSSNTLRVLGDATDSVFVNYGSWTAAGTVADGGLTFDIYTNGNATLELQQGVGRTGFPIAAIEVSALSLDTDGRGFVIDGVSPGDYAGQSVSSAGDVNGDGLDDLILGVYYSDRNGLYTGASFVVFGKTDGTAVALSDVEQSVGGFVINGVTTGDNSGRSVSSAGDVNGDGYDDLVIGAWGDDPNGANSGASFVVFGKTDSTSVDLSAVQAGTGGFVINGVSANDLSGWSVSSAGDVNGDGFDDIIVGAWGDSPNGRFFSGASFVVFGKTDGTAVELSSVQAGTSGFVINGVSSVDYSGKSVSSAGDVNGDGFDDLIVGAFGGDQNGSTSGASFVVFGKTDGTAVELSSVQAGTGGFVIKGVSKDDRSGYSVSSAGDVNGDGLDDLIVGAPRDKPNGTRSGASFVVFGKSDGTAVELADVEAGRGGFVINGASAFDQSGYSVSLAGDVNADGFDDLIVGAWGADPNGYDSGASFVVFGKTDGTAVDLSDVVAGTGGFVINGEAEYDNLGLSVSSAGDVNGDGFDDLIVGAPFDDPNGYSSGASFVVFGGDFTGAATQVGTFSDDALTGTAARDVLVGGTGNDTLVGGGCGGGGGDVLYGGAGDDLLAISDLAFMRIDGGNGTDTLRLDGTGLVLDLTLTGSSMIDGIERINLGGNSNQLILDQIQLQRLSDSSNTLRVMGDATDRVVVNSGSWTVAGTVTEGALTFDIYTNGNATLELQQGVGQTGLAAAAVPAIELSEIELDTDARGFVINGVSMGDRAGSVSSAGDVNGDGFDDLIVGAYLDDPNGNFSGASFVVFGKTDGTALELSDVEAGTGGFAINGVSVEDQSGLSVSSAGDVNGDGLGDLIIGAKYDDPNGESSGASFVVFGKTDGAVVELSAIEAGMGGFVMNGVSAGDFSGHSVSSAGDVNADGFDDLIVGAPGDGPNGNGSGASFVVFGKTDGTAVALSDVEAGDGGFVINGSAGDVSGASVSSAGDVNGDGFDDLIIGAPDAAPNGPESSASFVVFGKTDGTVVNLSAVEAGTGGFVINGVSEYDKSAWSVSSAGDVNGDGFDDLIIGFDRDGSNGFVSGASFVVFGKTDGTAVELSDVKAGTGGFVLNGILADDLSINVVSSAGDVNGDGLDDLIVGDKYASPNQTYSGASYVIFGKTDATAVEMSDVKAGKGGFVINGASELDLSGFSVSAAGDVNGDGYDDMIVGAPWDRPNGSLSGASFVVFGGDFSGAATQVGTFADDALTGTADRDVLVGGTGNDTMIGGGGADVLYGGAGDDLLAISDLAFMRIDGGNGTDTLRLDGTGLVLDLTLTGSSMIDGIERIDLGGNGNQLILDQIQLQRLSDSSNTLRVMGDATDRVVVNSGSWTAAGTLTEGALTFDIYTNGNATLELQQGVRQSLPIAAIELSAISLNSDVRGFVINGVSADDLSGTSVSSAGDVNGDGFDDFIIGAPRDKPNGNLSGASFVVFGKTDGTALELSDVERGTGGFVINGASEFDNSGYSVSSAGDVNGDGLDDLIVGAQGASPTGLSGAGSTYVVFGKTDGTAVDLAEVAQGGGGFAINGAAEFDFAGASVSSAGDVNGDGFADLIVGLKPMSMYAGYDTPATAADVSFVIFGKADGTKVDLSDVTAGGGGFVIKGAFGSGYNSFKVGSAGDVNGDGFDDLIVGVPGDSPNGAYSGASFVVFGKTDGAAVDLSGVMSGTGGFVINGVSAYDHAGFSVSSAGDVNGDGFDDVIIGAKYAGPNGRWSGASYVVFGKANGTAVELSDVEHGTGGFAINGVSNHDKSGYSVSSAGDVNGDGLDDLIVGALEDDPNGTDSGASFVVFGKTDGTPVELSDVEAGIDGFVINGVSANDQSGSSVSAAGDVNGDGFDDLIIGARFDGPNGVGSGASFVVFGGNFTGAATEVGTVGNDALTGTLANDVMFAGTGNDTLDGGGGVDRLSGGAGADTFVFRNLEGTTTILDFDGGEGDLLNISDFGLKDFAAFEALLTPEGPGGHDTRINLGADTVVILENITPDDLVASHVML